MIDASHANSRKIPARQVDVSMDIATQVERGSRAILGLMLESHMVAGRQDVVEGVKLTYGQSITDACMGWDDTLRVLDRLAKASNARRSVTS